MGYTTKFKGRLDFDCPITMELLADVAQYFGADGSELVGPDAKFTYIDLELTDDLKGIQWDSGTEKNYGMVEAVNFIIDDMHEKGVKDFALKGELLAQGEDIEDRWKLVMRTNRAYRVDLKVTGKRGIKSA